MGNTENQVTESVYREGYKLFEDQLFLGALKQRSSKDWQYADAMPHDEFVVRLRSAQVDVDDRTNDYGVYLVGGQRLLFLGSILCYGLVPPALALALVVMQRTWIPLLLAVPWIIAIKQSARLAITLRRGSATLLFIIFAGLWIWRGWRDPFALIVLTYAWTIHFAQYAEWYAKGRMLANLGASADLYLEALQRGWIRIAVPTDSIPAESVSESVQSD